MGVRTILLLLLVAAALGGLLLLTDQKPPIARTAETAVLDGRSLTQAKRIRWQLRDRAPIEIGRLPDGRFQLTEPLVDVASAAYMKQIVDAWDSAHMRKTPLADDENGRREAGLDAPAMVFAVDFDDGRRIEVEVGDPGPLGTTRFLRRDGLIWEGGAALLESMHVGLMDLRERAVFRNAFAQASEVRVEQRLDSGRREGLHIALQGGEWRLVAPIKGRADPVAAQRFVTSVVALRADDFPPGLVRFPERDPEIVVIVRGTAGEETVRLWQEMGQVYGQIPGRGVTFTSDNNQYSSIFVNAVEELRARVLLPSDVRLYEGLTELIIDPGQGRGERIRLLRSSELKDWRLVEPVDSQASATTCNEVIYALHRLVAREFVVGDDGGSPLVRDPRYGLGPERLVVAVRAGERAPLVTLWFGAAATRPGEPLVYACRSDDQENIVLVQQELVAELRRPWTDYCDRQVVMQSAIVERIDIAHRDGRARQFLLRDGVWVDAAEGQQRREVGEFVNDVLRDLVGTRAVDMRTGFGEPDWTIAMLRVNGDGLGRISIWELGEGESLVVRAKDGVPIGYEVGVRVNNELRQLWK